MNEIVKMTENAKGEYCVFKSGRDFHKIAFKDIYYLESKRNHVHIHTKSSEYVVYSSLEKFIENFPKKTFLKAHGSFVVNIIYISQILSNEIVLLNNEMIPLSRTYRNEIKTAFRWGIYGE